MSLRKVAKEVKKLKSKDELRIWQEGLFGRWKCEIAPKEDEEYIKRHFQIAKVDCYFITITNDTVLIDNSVNGIKKTIKSIRKNYVKWHKGE